MNLFTKLFGSRAVLAPQSDTLYWVDRSMPLRTAIEAIAVSSDRQWLATCISHYSGFIREATIKRAAELGDSSFLEPIVDRVNDWVPEVRKAATDALLALLATIPVSDIVAILPKLRGLVLANRVNHRAWLLEFEQQLVRAGGSEAIIDAMSGEDFGMRRAAFLVARDHQLLPVAELVKHGLLSGDIVLAQCAMASLTNVQASDWDTCIGIAIASPFGSVRHSALQFVVRQQSDLQIDSLLRQFVFDPQGSLRSAAARIFAEHGGNVVGHCESMLDAGSLNARQIRAALSNLVEWTAPEVAETLARYAGDKRGEIRAHALMLLAKVCPARADDIALRALLDASRSVRKIGVRLCMRGAFVTLDQVGTMLAQSRDHAAATAICARDRWDSLACIALMIGDDDFDAGAALKRWIDVRSTAGWSKAGTQSRQILTEPSVVERLMDLAGDGKVELGSKLKEGGIDV